MSKKYIVLLLVAIFASLSGVMAESYTQQIQSPIYTDNIGRSHFLGKGGYAEIRQTSVNQNNETFLNSVKNEVPNIRDKSPEVPVSAKTQDMMSNSDTQFDLYTPSRVNDSKTIYTDELGRLHFFGRGNLIRE